MKIMFQCSTCGGPVGYDRVETDVLRRFESRVHRHVCVQPCATCSAPEPSHDALAFETANEPRPMPGLEFQPMDGLLQEAVLAGA